MRACRTTRSSAPVSARTWNGRSPTSWRTRHAGARYRRICRSLGGAGPVSSRPRSREHAAAATAATILHVGEHSRQELARRADVNLSYVDRLIELGILSPGPEDTFSRGDVRRARWVRSFERAGVPLDGLAAAVREGALSFSYLDVSAFDRFAEVSSTTFRQLSESTRISMDLLKVVRESVGSVE